MPSIRNRLALEIAWETQTRRSEDFHGARSLMCSRKLDEATPTGLTCDRVTMVCGSRISCRR